MIGQPSRRALLFAGAAACAVASTAAAASQEARPCAFADGLAAAHQSRNDSLARARSARKALARWGEQNPRPPYSGDGQILVAWLDAYRAKIGESGAPDRHLEHQAAHGTHRALCERIAEQAHRTPAGAKALAELVPYDCDGILQAATLATVARL